MPPEQTEKHITVRGGQINVPDTRKGRNADRHQPDTPVRKDKSAIKPAPKKTRKAKPKEPPPPKDDAPVDLEE